jgi:CRISPR-associated endonuclease Cas1
VVIAHELVRRKLLGQHMTLAAHLALPGRARGLQVLGDARQWLELPKPPPWLCDLGLLRTFEGRAAHAYFAAWRGYALHWTKADARRVPPHWLQIRERMSPRSESARHAVDPCNAVLNYAYALLEGQCRQALTRLGFDVACGFLHLDKAGRDSLVYDLMECERGTVDGLVLDFLTRTTLHWGDVMPITDGSCRLHPQLARAVVASCRVPQDRVDEHARWLRAAVLKLPVQLDTVPPTSAVSAVPAVGYRHTNPTKRRPRTRNTERVGQYRPF